MTRLGARLVRCAASLALGAAWSAGTLGVMLSPGMLWCWRRAPSRVDATLSAWAYYAGAAMVPLFELGTRGYGDLSTLGLMQCAAFAALVAASVWGALWAAPGNTSWYEGALRTGLGLMVMALPGFGVLGLAHPATAAGLWLPGTGWLGLGLHTLALTLCTASARALGLWACIALACSGVLGTRSEARTAASTTVVDSALPVPGVQHYAGQLRTALGAQRAVPPLTGELVVLAEGVGGLWSATMRRVWEPLFVQLARTNTALVMGATEVTYAPDGSRRYMAVGLLHLPSGQERVVRQRVPLPFLMWRPWQRDGSYEAHWWESGIVESPVGRLGVLICYEQQLVFPVLWSVAGGAQALVGLANVHEIGGRAVMRWQAASMRAWAALFALPTALAVNK